MWITFLDALFMFDIIKAENKKQLVNIARNFLGAFSLFKPKK